MRLFRVSSSCSFSLWWLPVPYPPAHWWRVLWHHMPPVSEQVVFLDLLACRLVPWCFLCCYSSYPQGGEYASHVFGCIVCNTATTIGLSGVLFLCILGGPLQFGGFFRLWVSFSTVCLRWIHFSSTSLGCWSFCFCICVWGLCYVWCTCSYPPLCQSFSLYIRWCSWLPLLHLCLQGVCWWSYLFSVSIELPSPLTDVRFRKFSSFDGT